MQLCGRGAYANAIDTWVSQAPNTLSYTTGTERYEFVYLYILTF